MHPVRTQERIASAELGEPSPCPCESNQHRDVVDKIADENVSRAIFVRGSVVRGVAWLVKAASRPSALMEKQERSAVAGSVRPVAVDTDPASGAVLPNEDNTSNVLFVSPGVRLLAIL